MSKLAAVQHDFQQYMLHGDAAIESRVVGTTRVPIETRLAIYGGGYGARLIEALQNNYPVLAKLLGETDFTALAGEYVRSHDSSFASIRYYGAAMTEFLGARPAYAAAPVLAELARWEWAMTEVFDAADAQPIDLNAMAAIAPEQWSDLTFELHPSVRRLGLAWNVPPIWKALTNDAEPPEVTVGDEPQQWLLWRRGLDVYFRSLTTVEAAALDAARNGKSFGEICAAVCDWSGEAEAPAYAAGCLREWIQSGLITRIASA